MRRATLVFIFVTVALDMLALGIIVPVLPKLVLEFEGGDSARAAAIYGLFGTTFAAMQFVCAPVLGALSDRFGRRPFILLSNLGLGLDYLLMALAPSLAWLFVGRTVAGIFSASVSIPGAYIADVTPPERRAASYGLLSAAFGLGFIIGPAVGGLAGSVSPRLPFWIAAALSLANVCYGVFVLPESLPPERRAHCTWSRANPLSALSLLRRRSRLLGLSAVAFLSYWAHEALPSTFVLYTDHRFGWTEDTVGLVLAALGLASVVVQTGLVRPVVARAGERRSLLLGIGFGLSGFLVHGLAPTGRLFCLGVPLISLWGFWGPAAQGLMTRQVEASEQGRLQGALAGLRGIGGLVGPGLFTGVFAAAVADGRPAALAGAPYMLAALMLAAAFALAWRTTHDCET
ncbi:MAG TPA: TCR/Tet family MFS transporter [Candidatus Limnocylindria bacterium]|nr:TCR/Tet family MFS transporter [Candidatus Limnocylindria bacterium]